MKIFQVVPYFPPHIGGLETYVSILSRMLAARGHEVTVFTSSQGEFSVTEEVDAVRIHRLRALVKIYNNPVAPSLFAKLFKEDRPDILHAHQYPIFFSEASALAGLVRRIPIVTHLHVIPEAKSVLSSVASSFYYKLLWKFTLRSARKIAVPSLAYKSLLLRLGYGASKIRLVPYGVDVEMFNAHVSGKGFRKKYGCEDSRVVLTVGRLNYQKGFHVLIKALRLIRKEFKNAKLVIVGEGEDRGNLEKLARELKLADAVIFAGALPYEELPKAYAASDVFVLPSFFESFGIALIEAEAVAKPVVGTRVGGVTEAVVAGQSGILVEPGNPGSLAEAVEEILADRSLAKKMGENGRKNVEEKFSWPIAVDRVTAVYREILRETCLS
jgi:glycosyltransferase involved in cell wall biosynthesis